uniref:25S rRNA (uridine-N(3))-methyltransferase BMT5-like domain-containing protein n=1 Tax=Tetraselmis sp. GSL018 TaxID=582737 RepID=A0A061S5U1_9CHLO
MPRGSERPFQKISSPFTRVIFNFPHTGSQRVHLNRLLLRGFFSSVQPHLAEGGEVHVTIKAVPPYSRWDIPAQAEAEGLQLSRKVPFRFADYPGYQHRTTEQDAVKFDAFEKKCVTLIFAATPQKPSEQLYKFETQDAAVLGRKQPEIQLPNCADRLQNPKEPSASVPKTHSAAGSKRERNKKLRAVQQRAQKLKQIIELSAVSPELPALGDNGMDDMDEAAHGASFRQVAEPDFGSHDTSKKSYNKRKSRPGRTLEMNVQGTQCHMPHRVSSKQKKSKSNVQHS